MRTSLFAAAAACLAAAAAESVTYMLPMRDGTELHTVVDFPVGYVNGSRVATIMERSPYGANAEELIATVIGGVLGYVAIRQDMRGTGQSQGWFELWHDSRNDAYDTIEWLSTQPWWNGTVYTIGASADALDQYAQISGPHPALKAQGIIFASAAGWETFYIGGAYRKSLIEGWLSGLLPANWTNVVAEVKQEEFPDTPWWDVLNGTLWYQNAAWPAVHWAGWWDIFQLGNLWGFEGYSNRGSPLARGRQRLVIDPLGHCQHGASMVPRNTVVGRAALPLLEILNMYTTASGANASPSSYPSGGGAEGTKAITFYVIGPNELAAPGGYWTTLDQLPRYTPTDYFLGAGGTLSTHYPFAAPSAGAEAQAASWNSTSFTYNPADPTPTIGGLELEIPCGPLDQRPNENRTDLLIFTSDALVEQVAITGPVEAFISLTVPSIDADIVVKLIDSYPADSPNAELAGASILVADGITRLRWRNAPEGATAPQYVTPGTVVTARVTLWNTSYIFAPNHRIRLHVAAANYPRFDASSDTGALENATAPNAVPISVEVWHAPSRNGVELASRISLPVVDAFTQLPPFNVLDAARTAAARFEPAWLAATERAGDMQQHLRAAKKRAAGGKAGKAHMQASVDGAELHPLAYRPGAAAAMQAALDGDAAALSAAAAQGAPLPGEQLLSHLTHAMEHALEAHAARMNLLGARTQRRKPGVQMLP